MNLTVGHSEGTTSSNYGLNLQIGPLSMMLMIMVMIMMILMVLLMLVVNRCLDGLFCIFDPIASAANVSTLAMYPVVITFTKPGETTTSKGLSRCE